MYDIEAGDRVMSYRHEQNYDALSGIIFFKLNVFSEVQRIIESFVVGVVLRRNTVAGEVDNYKV